MNGSKIGVAGLALVALAILPPPCQAGDYQQAVRATKSLVSHYTFDDDTPKDAVASHHGRIVGGGVTYGPGLKGMGKAIIMRDGKAVVEFGLVKEFTFADGSGTVEVLIRNSGRNVGGTNYIFAQRKGWATDSMRYGFCFPGLKSINVVSRGARPNFMKAPVVLDPGRWYHLAVVYDKRRAAAAYVNGQPLRLSGAAPLAHGAKGHTFHLGGCNALPDWETWAGSFDELAIYADALPAATIRRHAKLAGCDAPIRTAGAPRPKLARPPHATGSRESLRRAIDDMTASFPKRYPDGGKFLARLAKTPDDDAKAFEKLQREALAANPLVCEQPLLFVTRSRYRSHYHAIDMLFHTGEDNWDRKCKHDALFSPGGAMKILDVKAGKVTTLIDCPQGVVRDPDVHWDGKRIVFAMRRKRDENYHIYEIGVDGTGLKQLTSLPGVADFDPVYLPDETIVFASTRDPKYNMCSRDHASNLYRMNADGSNIFRITRNTLFDNHPEVMSDGRILYARWEYVDRNFGDAHSIWVVNPDGTNQAIYWGNNTAVPAAFFNQHVIPGTHQVLGIFGPHHMVLEGALAIIDRTKGIDGRESVVRLWPDRLRNRPTIDHVRIGGRFDCDFFARFHPIYQDPWPLNEKYFLVTKTPARGHVPGIHLVDIFGNEVLLHAEAPGCYDAMPIAPRKRPPTIPTRRTFDSGKSYVVMQNVYEGTHMKGVKPGSIRYLRVVESGPKKTWSGGSWGGQGYEAPGMNWHDFTNKIILGEVPVEADGSAYFEVPSERFIFFQALDADRMMVQSMRSGTVVQPGETQSCIGCHEDRLKAQDPAAAARALALKRPPSKLEGWYGPERQFSYMKEVQPVFNKHCLKCHDFGGKAAAKLILAGDRNPYFNASYIDLWIWRRKLIKCIGGGPAEIQQAYSWGSHPSRLSKILRDPPKQHKDLRLTREDLARINAWLDLNGPYWPDYTCAYPDSQSGRSPIPVGKMQRLCKLTDLNYGSMRANGRGQRAQISFERPQLSPCLARIKDKNPPAYAEVLAIIRAGAEMLKTRPRCDMDGFVPCADHQNRLKWFDTMEAVERAYRTAIRTGKRLYDRDVASLLKDGKVTVQSK